LAQESYRLARDRLEECVEKMTGDPRLKQGELADLLRAVRTVEAQFYQAFVELRGHDPGFQAERATTFRKLALVTAILGNTEEALVHYSRAREIFATLVRDHPDVRRYQALLARTHDELAILYNQNGRWVEAEQAFQQALTLERVLATSPSRPEDQHDLALFLLHLGALYVQTDRLPEAERAYREALGLKNEVVQGHSNAPGYQRTLAASYHQLGVLYMKTRRFPEAEQLLQESLGLGQSLVKACRKEPKYRAALARTYNDLCYVYQNTDRPREAEQALQEALTLKQDLVKDHPLVMAYAVDLGGTQCNLGGLAQENGDLAASLDWLSKSIPTLEAVLTKDPRHATAREFARNAYLGRFVLLNEMRRYIESLHDSNRILELLEGSPKRDDFRVDRAVTLARLQRLAEAIAEAEDLLRLGKSRLPWLCQLARVYALSAAAPDAVPEQAEHYAARTVGLLRQAMAAGYKDVEALKKDADFDAVRQRPDFQKLLSELEQSQESNQP
jgi:tetratricopeptide (TPR) repeat protein